MLRRLPILIIVSAAIMACSKPAAVEPGVSQPLAQWRAARYSDVHYKIDLTLEKMSPVLTGTMEIKVNLSEPPASAGGQSPTEAEALTLESKPQIVLDWRRIKGNEARSTISNVLVNGNPVAVSPNWPPADAGGSDINEHLIFRDGVVLGENVIKLDFTSPILNSGSAITRYVDKEDGAEYIYSLFVPSDASTAFPVFDQPDLKARFTLNINRPADWQVVSNGIAGGSNERQGGSVSLTETQPISSYVFAFAAGPFEKFTDSESEPPMVAGGSDRPSASAIKSDGLGPTGSTSQLQLSPAARGANLYLRRSQAAKFKPHAAEVFRLNHEGIKFLEEYFDYKFPFPKYDLVLIPEFPFGGMEHAGATFLREDRIIFPQEPTKNDYISRANLIFHEAAHQWFGDTVTMRWFDDLWLKEGFAEFMAYKTLERVMPEYNAWKVFYERNKQAAYLTDSTKGTTPIYQEINNLSAAKSAYGNIVYRKAPSFLKQAEFFLGPERFQTAVRAFLKKHEFSNASWGDLVTEFEAASGRPLGDWAKQWVTQPGLPIIRSRRTAESGVEIVATDALGLRHLWEQKFEAVFHVAGGSQTASVIGLNVTDGKMFSSVPAGAAARSEQLYFFPNRNDYGYGIFLLDDESREFILNNIQYEKDDFLRTMLWGSLWDSVREAELDPKQYVELVVKVLGADLGRPTVLNESANRTLPIVQETDESTIQTLLGRVSTAMRYYVSDEQRAELAPKVETLLIEKMQKAQTPGQRITYYRAFLGIASTSNARRILKEILQSVSPSSAKSEGGRPAAAGPSLASRTKDRFDIVSRLVILGDPDAEKLLTSLEATETSDEAKRYAYAVRAGVATPETKARYWNDFTSNKDISESWIEAAFVPFNSVRQSGLTLPYLEKALAELPNLKRDRKIFFVNGWLGAFIGGHKSEGALAIVNRFLADTPSLDNDLRLKILENVDTVERAVKIRNVFGR